MELRQRKSPLIKKYTAESPSTAAATATATAAAHHPNTSSIMAADLVTPRTSAEASSGEKKHRDELLEEENVRLRQELEEMKKLVQRYEDNTSSTNRRKSRLATLTSSPRSAKRSPPPPPLLPSLREQGAAIMQSSPANRRRASPRDIDTTGREMVAITTPPTGLHHRTNKYPTTSQDDNEVLVAQESSTSNIDIGSPRSTRATTTAAPSPGAKRTIQSKFRNSGVFHSDDDDDLESPRPSHYAEGVSLLPSDELHHQQQDDGLVMAATSFEQEKDVADDDVDAVDDDNMDFRRMILDRAGWLVGLLVLQSMSSFIIQRNEGLLQKHLVLVRFLTMLVGAGGNAGNQASVRVIRGLAIGTIKSDAVRPFLLNELLVGLCLSVILGVAGCLRAAVFMTPFAETFAITASLFMIVMISVILGATLPLGMKMVGIDPAHSSTTIQVLMDILGVTITVSVSALVLDSAIGTKWGFKNTGTV
mmetsp:Transcript_6706/g.11068  ORF Transcript_6706/g.11068 Transcript_6706/m.11068 type:complete len:477 (-) Transcript_6706:24-1454(-)